jgi:ribosomal protein S18 acetylase RimI-like enzyme
MHAPVAPLPVDIQRDDNQDTTAVSQQSTMTMKTMVTVQPLTMELLTANDSFGAAQITRAYNEGAGAKKCCLCCPLAEHPSGRGVIKYLKKNSDRLPCWGIAVDGDGRLLGYVAMTFHPKSPMDGLHKTKPGEAYIDQVMVSSDARGRGVGTKLLEWAEALARERDAKVLSLEVLNGNPARRLYERFGLTEQPAGFCTRCCISPLFICCFASQHYGCSHWGSILMTKNLQ